MILKLKETHQHISQWVSSYFKSHGRKTAIINLSGDLNSSYLSLLIKQANLPLLCVILSTPNAKAADNIRAVLFAKEFNLPLAKLNLTLANNIILNKIDCIMSDSSDLKIDSSASLKETLKDPILNFYAEYFNGLILDGRNKTDLFIRNDYKRTSADLLPLADLYFPEIKELFQYVLPNGCKPGQEIIDHHSTAYEKLNLKYNEAEWAVREDEKNHLISQDNDPTKSALWYRYTVRQQEIICKLHQVEKATRHKKTTLPICEIRNLNLVT